MKFVKMGLIAAFMFYFYLLVGLFVNKGNYYHPESIFLIEKGLLAFKGNPPRLENIGLIYPPLPFYVLFPFIYFVPLASPFLASALVMSVLVLFISYRLMKYKAEFPIFLLFLISLMLNPAMIYAGSSGGSLHLYLTFLSIFYVFIFEYHSKPVSFYLALAGISLGILVFIRYETIFILPTLFLATVFLAIETTIEKEVSYLEFFKLLIKLPAYRKTFMRKGISLYLMFFIPPVFAFASWVYLNWLFTSNPFFFIDSPYAYFRTLKTYIVFNPRLLDIKGDILKSSFEVFKLIFLISPMFFFVLFLFRRKIFHVLVLIAPVLDLVISAYLGLTLLNLDFFVPFVILSFIGLAWAIFEGEVKNVKAALLIYVVLFLWSLHGSFNVLKNSNYPEEKMFVETLFKGKTDLIFEEEIKIANFLKKIVKDDETILIDDGYGYPIVAFHGEPKNFILPYQHEFYSVVQSPKVYADYILVPNPATFEGARDALNIAHRNLFQRGSENLSLVYASNKWKVFRSNFKFKIKEVTKRIE